MLRLQSSKSLLVGALLALYFIWNITYAQTLSPIATTVDCLFYNTYLTARVAVFILATAFALLGAALYAGSHIMPGSHKGSMQGYGMGMLMGSVAGVVIAVLSPFVLQAITSGASTANIALVAQVCAPANSIATGGTALGAQASVPVTTTKSSLSTSTSLSTTSSVSTSLTTTTIEYQTMFCATSSSQVGNFISACPGTGGIILLDVSSTGSGACC